MVRGHFTTSRAFACTPSAASPVTPHIPWRAFAIGPSKLHCPVPTSPSCSFRSFENCMSHICSRHSIYSVNPQPHQFRGVIMHEARTHRLCIWGCSQRAEEFSFPIPALYPNRSRSIHHEQNGRRWYNNTCQARGHDMHLCDLDQCCKIHLVELRHARIHGRNLD